MTPATELLDAIDAAGGRVVLCPGGVVVEPVNLLDDTLRGAIKAHGRELVELLGRRASTASTSAPPAPSPSAPPIPSKGSCCELRRFPDRPDRLVVRLCCEPEHQHEGEDSIPIFNSEEIDLLLAWVSAAGVQQFSHDLRDYLLAVKVKLGGKVDAETAVALAEVTGS